MSRQLPICVFPHSLHQLKASRWLIPAHQKLPCNQVNEWLVLGSGTPALNGCFWVFADSVTT